MLWQVFYKYYERCIEKHERGAVHTAFSGTLASMDQPRFRKEFP